MTNPPGHKASPSSDIASHLQNDATPEAGGGARGPGPQRDAAEIMDMEKSLVERIADVDDERRRTSTQVRKALLAHRDEVDQTLAAYRRALTVLLAVCVLLAAGLGWLVFGQQQLRAQSRDAQAAALAAARAVDADEAAGSAETDRLDERVQSLDERLGALDQRIATALDDDAVAAALSAMQDRVASVEAQLGAVREAQRPAPEAGASGAGDAAGSAGTEQLAQRVEELESRLGTVGELLAEALDADQERSALSMLQDRLAILETQLGALDQAATPAEQAAGAPEDAAAESEQAREQATEGPATAAPPTGRPITDEPPAAEPERQPLAQAPQAPAAETLPEDQGAENETDAAPDAASSAVAAAEPTGEAKPPLSAEATAPEPAADRPRIALQLIGLRSREGIDAFIAEHELPETVYLRRETFRGRPWFALIHSLHPSRDAAAEARGELPDDLVRLDVWLRELPANAELEPLTSAGNAADAAPR